MELLSQETLDTMPSLAIPPADLFEQESLRDLGDGQSTFTDAATRVKAAE